MSFRAKLEVMFWDGTFCITYVPGSKLWTSLLQFFKLNDEKYSEMLTPGLVGRLGCFTKKILINIWHHQENTLFEVEFEGAITNSVKNKKA